MWCSSEFSFCLDEPMPVLGLPGARESWPNGSRKAVVLQLFGHAD